MQKITVDDVLLQTIVTLLNVGARKAGLGSPPPAEGETPPEPDLEQVRQAVEGARALLPLVEERHKASSSARQRRAVAAADVLRPALGRRSRPPPEPRSRRARRPAPRRAPAGSGFRGSRRSRRRSR